MPRLQPEGLLKTHIVADRGEAERAVAAEIARGVQARNAQGQDFVLGLAAGRSPEGVYRELVRLVQEEDLDLSRVTTFNLDEYEGLAPEDPNSFRFSLERELFQPGGLDPARIHFPSGLWGEQGAQDCAAFEESIRAAGGIDLQLLGLGRNGHLAFNEPGATRDSRTRRVRLAEGTRADAAATFGSLETVPTHAVTMGLATIREARRLRVLAFGATKTEALRGVLADPPDESLPACLLRAHPDVELWMDRAAAPGA